MHLQTIFVLLTVLSVVVISSGVPQEEQTAVFKSREKRSPLIGGLARKLGRFGRLSGRLLKRFSKRLLKALKSRLGKIKNLGPKLKKLWKKKWPKLILKGAAAAPILIMASLRLAKALRCKSMARGLDDYMQYAYCQTALVRNHFADLLGNKDKMVKGMDGQIKFFKGTVLTHCKKARVNTNLKPCRYGRCASTPSTYGDLSKYKQLGCLPFCDLENVDTLKSCRKKLKNLFTTFADATKSTVAYLNKMKEEVERLQKLNKGVPGLS